MKNKKMKLTVGIGDELIYEIAHAIGQDAGNRSMRKAGRKVWNRKDYNKAAETMSRLLGPPNKEVE